LSKNRFDWGRLNVIYLFQMLNGTGGGLQVTIYYLMAKGRFTGETSIVRISLNWVCTYVGTYLMQNDMHDILEGKLEEYKLPKGSLKFILMYMFMIFCHINGRLTIWMFSKNLKMHRDNFSHMDFDKKEKSVLNIQEGKNLTIFSKSTVDNSRLEKLTRRTLQSDGQPLAQNAVHKRSELEVEKTQSLFEAQSSLGFTRTAKVTSKRKSENLNRVHKSSEIGKNKH
jgi:hypothetical protein